MRTRAGQVVLCVLLVCGMGCGRTSRARERALRVFDAVETSPVLRLPLTLGPGASVLFESRKQSRGAVPVLHLWDDAAKREVARAQGSRFFGRGARLGYQNPGGVQRSYTLVVHALDARARGHADLLRDGRMLLAHASIGGAVLEVAGGEGVRYEVAAAPEAPRATALYALAESGELLGFADGGGRVGLPRLEAGARVRSLVVGPRAPEPGPGRMRVYVNDPADHDGDGLGRALERALGTCDGPREPGCGGSRLADYYWSVPHATRDSDRDGLDDGEELLGVPAPRALDLPRFGADPRHKDVLVEVDHQARVEGAGLSEDDIADIARLFAAGSAFALRNPDGLPGVRLHLDVGFAPRAAEHAGLFGDFGGSNAVKTSHYKEAYKSAFDPARRGYFRYALLTRGGTGQASGDAFGINRDFHRVPVFAHELGHTLGLAHHGHDAWGNANCKPNYVSIMNYVYQNRAEVGFSTGAGSVLDPSRVLERAGIGGPAPAALGEPPLEFDLDGQAVDWNRDGVISDEPIRAGLQWATFKSCGAAEHGLEPIAEGELPAATPVLVKLGASLHALWLDAGGALFWRKSPTSGPDERGSCPEAEASSARCTTWSAPVAVAGLTRLRHIAGLALPAATGGERLLLAYVGDNGRVHSSVLALEATAPQVLSDVELPGSESAHAPALASMPVEPARYGVSRVLAFAWRAGDAASGGRLMLALALDPRGPFFRAPMLDQRLQPIASALGPSLLELGTGELCGAFADLDAYIRFYCHDRGRDLWQDLSEQAFYATLGPRSAGAIGLAYHRYRTAEGAPIGGDASRGAVILSFTEPDADGKVTPENPHLLISEWLSARAGAVERLYFRWRGSLINQWTNVAPGTGVTLYEDETLSALKALMLSRPRAAPRARLEFLPFADGAYPAKLGSGNDFEVMERGICVGLRGQTACGGPATGAY